MMELLILFFACFICGAGLTLGFYFVNFLLTLIFG